MSIKISSRKAKGRRLQQWVAKNISEIIGIPVKKDGEIESRIMGQSGTDIILRGKAKDLFFFATECKAQESWAIHDWIKQAKSNVGDFKTWLLFCKRNNENPVVVMEADYFFEMYKLILKNKEIINE